MFPRTLIRRLVNGAWIAAGAREHARFSAALGRVAATQSDYLLTLLRQNAGTRFGARHNFARIRSVADYQAAVPIAGYEALGESIEAIARGEAGVLTADRVQRFQPTSGSSAATKFIPWTAALGREFQRGIAPWLVSLYHRHPALLRGTAYWSVSPPTVAAGTHGRLRVGFDHDAEYLGFLGRQLFSLVSAAPPGLARCRDMREFKTRTLGALLADENVALISVWSPTFLTTLLDEAVARRAEILDLLSRHRQPGVRKRAELLRRVLPETRGVSFAGVWPNLRIISCWTHGPSGLYAENLRHGFPGVEIQGKGLVATEAFISLPFQEEKDPVLAVNSHFFEFRETAGDRLFLAHALRAGDTYRVIVTTGGGLYRYALGDRVQVTGFIGEAPCLRFIGREGNVSDHFGEKLEGAFVGTIVRRALAQRDIAARFFLLAPATETFGKLAYTLFLEADAIPDAVGLQRNLEEGLAANFHYAHCRHLGQLSPARVFQINGGAMSGEAAFQQAMLARGLKLGDIKMAPLDHQPGWERHFGGQYVS